MAWEGVAGGAQGMFIGVAAELDSRESPLYYLRKGKAERWMNAFLSP